MTTPAPPAPQRRHAQANRARILEVARRELSRNPESPLDEIARASGVVRRTLYGHFPGRTALLEALADEASAALRGAVAAATRPADPPEYALARFKLEIWKVGDRYRMLLALARRDLGHDRVRELADPATEHTTRLLERGQAAGVFATHLPAPVLGDALAAVTFSLLESVNLRKWDDDGSRAAIAGLVMAGVSPARAAEVLRGVLATSGGAR
ncbi:TetR/AcrR family transcriptional regulator [Streptomyces sp. B1866]|uniref:TetR/AcrR family transcriptional regulator n=1 Tax=Streptomyces sp. B1866 TaxID=3075431 RepID=UPI00288F86BD|nr:TetR/AcrR family transcriptional regulator [Streptomyces sp. B1866]MDT3397723.1 TetR/AcrR family transcriptional regulator [Streptomyces sp. B1866]